MERPKKRPRLDAFTRDKSDDDDDELNYDPEEILQKRDPGFRLAQSRATAALRLKSTFESIFEKYERDFSGVGDEIDLHTGEIVVNNGHLQSMRNEKDVGLNIPTVAMPARTRSSETALDAEPLHIVTSRTSKDEGGFSSQDNVHLPQEAIAPVSASRRICSNPSSSRLFSQRNSRLHLHQVPHQLDCCPHFNAQHGLGATEPIWQAPLLHTQPPRSSSTTQLFPGRYILPERDGSDSIWAPSTKDDGHDDDDGLELIVQGRKRSAPTRRTPPRTTPSKLIRVQSSEACNSGGEEYILTNTAIGPAPSTEAQLKTHTAKSMRVKRGSASTRSPERKVVEHPQRVGGGAGAKPKLRPAKSCSTKSVGSGEEPGHIWRGISILDGCKASSTLPPLSIPRPQSSQSKKIQGGSPPSSPLARNEGMDRLSSNTIVVELASSLLLHDSRYIDIPAVANQSPETGNTAPSGAPSPFSHTQAERALLTPKLKAFPLPEQAFQYPEVRVTREDEASARITCVPPRLRATSSHIDSQQGSPTYNLRDEEPAPMYRNSEEKTEFPVTQKPNIPGFRSADGASPTSLPVKALISKDQREHKILAPSKILNNAPMVSIQPNSLRTSLRVSSTTYSLEEDPSHLVDCQHQPTSSNMKLSTCPPGYQEESQMRQKISHDRLSFYPSPPRSRTFSVGLPNRRVESPIIRRHLITTPPPKSDVTPTKLIRSSGHRSLTSLVPKDDSTYPSSESENELTAAPRTVHVRFRWGSRLYEDSNMEADVYTRSSPAKIGLSDASKRPTLGRSRSRTSVHPPALFNTERPAAPDDSVVRTPGGTIRRCGGIDLKCGKDFCFTCS